MKDFVDRALIYSTPYYYMELILYVCLGRTDHILEFYRTIYVKPDILIFFKKLCLIFVSHILMFSFTINIEIFWILQLILLIFLYFRIHPMPLGQVYEKMEDENTACHWQTEAHRHYPVNLNVIRYALLEQRTWIIDAIYFHILLYARKRGLEKKV